MSVIIPSVVRLKRAIKINSQIHKLESELASILGESRDGARAVIAMIQANAGQAKPRKARKPYVFSPEARAKIAAAQKARWEKAGKA